MKLDFFKITSHERMPISILSLYLLAFPADERRPCQNLFALIDGAEPAFDFRVINFDGRVAGFVTTWDSGDFVYIEHFATLDHMRGHGIGAHALELLQQEAGKPLLLEVELPESGPMARRRIDFYRRHGMVPRYSFSYTQPPYAAGLNSLPMVLMTSADIDLEKARDFLYERVYAVRS